uniref:Acetyl-coenzyme A carboxylase carboxyl transferase subunit beta n=1 Tax=Aeginetia indica TaxID=290220 RepID=A0A8F2YVH8_9LAMI|nr:acetyl-CoA carboxylase carboxyl transferase beta subunit [Aeginetia indica]
MIFLCKFKEFKNSMKRWWFTLMVFMFRNKLKRRSIITKLTNDNLIENTNESEDPDIKVTDNIFDDTFLLVKDNKGDSFYIYFYYCNFIFMSNENIEENSLSIDDLYNPYIYDTQSCCNNTFTSFIDSYLQSKFCTNTPLVINDSVDNYFSECFDKRRTSSESSNLIIIKKSYNDFDRTQNYKQLWVQCETCYGLNYKKFLKSKMNICEQCGYPLKMNSSERIEVFIDLNTWNPMDKDMGSLDPIEFHSEEEPYKNRIDYYKISTGLTEAVQTGVGQLKGIPVAIGVMDFQFMGGSMGSVVGEKITRLIEYATNKFLPLIIVCASGGARMQEGSLSLMQMAKISSALYDYQSKKKLLYISILTSPTTGGVTASFGMLGDIIISEPNSYIAFAGKRVIEQTLNKTVPEGSQVAEYLFKKGLFDLIVPRNLLKNVVSELLKLHTFIPLNSNTIKN